MSKRAKSVTAELNSKLAKNAPVETPKKKEVTTRKGKTSSAEVPAPPTKPLSAFLQFRMKHFKTVQSENPGTMIGALSKIIGEMWAKVDPAEKASLEETYKAEQEKYIKEKQEYEQNYGKIQRKSRKSVEKADKSKKKPKN